MTVSTEYQRAEDISVPIALDFTPYRPVYDSDGGYRPLPDYLDARLKRYLNNGHTLIPVMFGRPGRRDLGLRWGYITFRPVERMSPEHLIAQLKIAGKAGAFYGYGRYILPVLENELARREFMGDRTGAHEEDWGIDEDHNEAEEESNTMNLRNLAVSLRKETLTTIVVYHDGTPKPYTYLCEKKLAERIQEVLDSNKPSPVVAVRNSTGITTGAVSQVHETMQIDIKSRTPSRYCYAFQLLDDSVVDEQERIDEAICKKLEERQERTAEEQALAALGISNIGEFVKALPAPGDSE